MTTNTNIVPFTFNNTNTIRVIEIEDESWFVAKDVADLLGYTHTPHMTRHLDSSEKLTSTLWTSGQNRRAVYINEQGFYEAIFNSRSPLAKKVKRWLKHEVLPNIRKNGGYVLGQENAPAEFQKQVFEGFKAMQAEMQEVLQMARMVPGLMQQVSSLEETNQQQRGVIEEQAPRVEAFDTFLNADGPHRTYPVH